MNSFYDKDNWEYHIVECGSDDFQRFNIEHRGIPVGYANVHFEGSDVLHLDDLHIRSDAVMPPLISFNMLFWTVAFPPLRWRTVNFRGRGLGTAMINFLANYARTNSAKRIEGEVKPYDFKDNPNLPNWYRRRGFYITDGDEKSAAVAKLTLAI